MKTNNKISTIQTHLGFWLRLVSNNVSNSFAKKLNWIDITVAEWVVLREIYDNETITSTKISNITGLTKGAVSKLIDRLVQKNYILRSESKQDRRFQNIVLTKTGKEIVPTLAQLADENDEDFFSKLNTEEKEQLLNLCKKIAFHKSLTTIPLE